MYLFIPHNTVIKYVNAQTDKTIRKNKLIYNHSGRFFHITHSITDLSSKQKMRKNIETLNNMNNKLYLIDMYG